MIENPRYAGKPLLRLLECYVLRAIDSLPEGEAKTLVNMTPKLQEIYGHSGQWHEIVAASISLPVQVDNAIREMWARNQKIAADNDIVLSAQQFAEMFVDDNLVG